VRTGTSATRETVTQAWSPVLAAAGGEGQELGRQILALAHQVAVHSLSGRVTDPGREPEEKAVLVNQQRDIMEEELTKLRADLEYQQKFLAGVEKKLSNESFVSKAPEAVIALEQKKKADAESRIASIEQSIRQLSGK